MGGTKLYSVIMVDLDHPDRDSAKPEDGQLANMIVTNIPGTYLPPPADEPARWSKH